MLVRRRFMAPIPGSQPRMKRFCESTVTDDIPTQTHPLCHRPPTPPTDPTRNTISNMDQSVKMSHECTGARASMASASERYNTCLCILYFPTPLIRGFTTVEFHRRVSEGAGAPRFCPRAFPMWEGLTGMAISPVGVKARIH